MKEWGGFKKKIRGGGVIQRISFAFSFLSSLSLFFFLLSTTMSHKLKDDYDDDDDISLADIMSLRISTPIKEEKVKYNLSDFFMI